MPTQKTQELENKFIEYSDRVHKLVFLLERGLAEYKTFAELVDMKKQLLMDTNEMMHFDQLYMRITEEPISHPNYEKFITYVKLAKRQLDREIQRKYPQL